MKHKCNKAMTKKVGEATRAAALRTGGKSMKGGKSVKASHGGDAKVIGHN
jgi:hypothetical protein